MELNSNFRMHPSLNSPKSASVKYQDQVDELKDNDGYTMNCFLCQQIFTDIDELQEHLSIHYLQCPDFETTTQYFNCNFCGRSLRSEEDLKVHHKRYHEATVIRKEVEADTSLTCKLCGYICESSNLLLKHVELTHVPSKEKEITAESAPMYVSYQYSGPKIKYPPRSPYFNPNLWVDPNGYI